MIQSFSILILALAIPLYALSPNEVECKAEMNWRTLEAGGPHTHPAGVESAKVGLLDDESSLKLELETELIGNDEMFNYFFSMDKKTGKAALRVGRSYSVINLNEEMEIGWSLGDPYRGNEKFVTCRRGGKQQVNSSMRLTCKALEVKTAVEIGNVPQTKTFPPQSSSLNEGSLQKFAFGVQGPILTAEMDRGTIYLWLGEKSNHKVDVFSFKANHPITVGIRESYGDFGYTDFSCKGVI